MSSNNLQSKSSIVKSKSKSKLKLSKNLYRNQFNFNSSSTNLNSNSNSQSPNSKSSKSIKKLNHEKIQIPLSIDPFNISFDLETKVWDQTQLNSHSSQPQISSNHLNHHQISINHNLKLQSKKKSPKSNSNSKTNSKANSKANSNSKSIKSTQTLNHSSDHSHDFLFNSNLDLSSDHSRPNTPCPIKSNQSSNLSSSTTKSSSIPSNLINNQKNYNLIPSSMPILNQSQSFHSSTSNHNQNHNHNHNHNQNHNHNHNRSHLRAKSVTSVLDLQKIHSISSTPSKIKDDWDMPNSITPRDLTWQQRQKSNLKSLDPSQSRPIIHHSNQKFISDPFTTSSTTNRSIPNSNRSKPIDSNRRHPHRNRLARTSSAGSLLSTHSNHQIIQINSPTRLDSSHFNHHPSSSSSTKNLINLDQNLPLTWQQTFLQSSPKNSLSTSNPKNLDPLELVLDAKSINNKKKFINPINFKTIPPPSIKNLNLSNRKSSGPTIFPPSPSINLHHHHHHSKRRNSTCSSPSFNQLVNNPLSILSSSSPCQALNHSLNSNPSPSNQIFNPSPNQNFQSKPFHLSSHSNNTFNSSQSSNLNIKSSSISDLNLNFNSNQFIPTSNQINQQPTIISNTPNKSKSTSQLLNFLTPNKIVNHSVMYAGPQFHNSPSPAALPAPKIVYASS